MSKMDNLRAMREARYERDQARAKAAGTAKPAPAKKAAASPAPATSAKAPAAAPATSPAEDSAAGGDEVCGHRSMNGRTCTREKGHAAKSHRYS